MKNRLADPSEIRAHDFEHAFRRSARRSVSASIDNDRSIFDICNTRTGYQPHGDLQQRRCSMEMAYRERWRAEIAELQRILSGFDLREECKWGKPCYTMDGKNVVIIQGFKEYCALGFFQGALLKDPKKLLVQLGQVQAARVMKFTSAKEIAAKAATIKAYLREAIGVEKAGLRVKPKKTSDFPVPEELTERFRKDPRFKRPFDALTAGPQRGYLY